MRVREFIVESITFTAVQKVKSSETGRIFWKSMGRDEQKPCWLCNGTGIDKHDHNKCEYCYGTGSVLEFVHDSPTLQVSNYNAGVILDMLDIKYDEYGIIQHNELSNLMRKLIRLKNNNVSSFIEPSSTKQGKMKKTIDAETGLTKIQRGPTIHNMGQSVEQIQHYIDILIKLVKFAQEHNAGVSWD